MMTTDGLLAALVALLGGVGVYLMLPHKHGRARPGLLHKAGLQASVLGLVVFITFLSPLDEFIATSFFDIFAVASIVSAVLMTTSRDPVHSALWFAAVVISTAGLFLLAGAPFLAAGTVIVYAGAIIVMFLFVIMLAQMEGRAAYDRAAHSPGAATLTCFVLLWCLLSSIGSLKTIHATPITTRDGQIHAEGELTRTEALQERYKLLKGSPFVAVITSAAPKTARIHDAEGAEKLNVAGLGESLYTDHLVVAGLSGVLLFVALIAAVAIANPKPPRADLEPARLT